MFLRETRNGGSKKRTGWWVVSIQRCLWLCRSKVAARHGGPCERAALSSPRCPTGRRPYVRQIHPGLFARRRHPGDLRAWWIPGIAWTFTSFSRGRFVSSDLCRFVVRRSPFSSIRIGDIHFVLSSFHFTYAKRWTYYITRRARYGSRETSITSR